MAEESWQEALRRASTLLNDKNVSLDKARSAFHDAVEAFGRYVDKEHILPKLKMFLGFISEMQAHPDKITDIQRKMFISSASEGWHGQMDKNYDVKTEFSFGDISVNSFYRYDISKSEIRVLDVNIKFSNIEESWVCNIPRDGESRIRKTNRECMTAFTMMLDALLDTRTGTKTPFWKDFVTQELDRYYAEMKSYCTQVLNRAQGKPETNYQQAKNYLGQVQHSIQGPKEK